MKKLLLTLLLLTSISQAFAQEKPSKLNPGIRGGWNMSNLTGVDGDYRTNFYLGLQLPIKLTKNYELQPEVIYSRQGTENALLDRYSSTPIRENISLDYIDINVINKFHFGKLNLQVGPGIAFLTNSNQSNTIPVDLTFNVGLGIDITKRIGVEARWMPGIINVNDDYWILDQFYFDDNYIRNNTFQIGAYFKF